MNKYSYYPGCSLHSSAKEYDLSTNEVFKTLGSELVEIPDWNCCGASSAHQTDKLIATTLALRNLVLAETMLGGMDIVVPCAACFHRLKYADYEIKEGTKIGLEAKKIVEESFEKTQRHKGKVKESRSKGVKESRSQDTESSAFSLQPSASSNNQQLTTNNLVESIYAGKVKARHPLEVVINDYGLDKIKSMVKKPLKGLKVVSYYGCLMVRPPNVCEFENPDNPVWMDKLMDVLGAESINWTYKTDCCGAAHAMSRTDIVFKLVNDLSCMAKEAGAEAFVCGCPLCMGNLDMRQKAACDTYCSGDPLPAFYFTELMGLAFGMDQQANMWFSKHLIPVMPLLNKLNLGSGF